MIEGKRNRIYRVLAILLGTFLLGITLYSFFINNHTDLWVGFFVGPVFLLYGIGGKKTLGEIFPGMNRDIK